ncbi:hypothetical protein [Mycolicibacterium fortuitum]|uniref:hypothetical protein n=4 Tax=Mycolicibacterium fortuitum TaxID=1766 RepID=UPI000A7D785D|nr:hypothetical protein [Mycolicibacterium fortuitum]MDV7195807.1 hypothetical protein [Mycolicibacterium fortuitum]NOQ62677.1 hypothetical protein [Mycolicibacterium fortuitum]
MHPRRSHDVAPHSIDTPRRPAQVVSLAEVRRRKIPTPPDSTPQPASTPNPLGSWVIQLINTIQNGCIVRTTMAPTPGLRDLITEASSHPTRPARGPLRLHVTPSRPSQFDAVERTCEELTQMGANPRLDIEIRLTPEHVHLAVRGVLADPVMTPDHADSITTTLQAATELRWELDITDTGTLNWQIPEFYSTYIAAALP